MLIRRHREEWSIKAPSKVNLFLEVLGRRSDGYHELCTVMAAISLCDELTFRVRQDGEIRLHVITPASHTELDSQANSAWQIPTDRSNLVVRALENLRKEMECTLGMDVWLTKAIPATAGLGGGSSDAAAALVAGMVAWTGKYDPDLLSSVAAQLGSDINFFLEAEREGNWIAVCGGRGEQVKPIGTNLQMEFVVAHPPEGCSTVKVFEALKLKTEIRSPENLIVALDSRNVIELGKQLYNRLEEPAGLITPWIGRMQRDFETASFPEKLQLGDVMTGSGSARFAICKSDQFAKRFAAAVAAQSQSNVYCAHSWRAPSILQQLQSLGITT